jgi:hypothetical protein
MSTLRFLGILGSLSTLGILGPVHSPVPGFPVPLKSFISILPHYRRLARNPGSVKGYKTLMLVPLASLLLAVAAEAPAEAVAKPPVKVADLDALVANPPFGNGTAASTPSAATPSANLELRGMYQEGEKTYFSLYNTSTKQSRWVAKDEAPADPSLPVFKSFDPETGALTVEVGGKATQVTMKAASVAKYEPPREPAPAPGAGGTGEPPRGGPALPEPGPDGKVQTPWGSFTPEQIAAYRAERERRWQERMQQVQAEGGDPRRAREPEAAPTQAAPRGEQGGRGERGGRGAR